MKKFLSILLAVLMVLSLCSFGTAEEAAVIDYAYLMYADAAWAHQNWGTESAEGMTVKAAEITGSGDYTVGVEFAEAAEGLAFTAVGVVNGELTCPGWYITVTDIRVNGESIQFLKSYTSSDDGVTTRSNLYNEWVSELPADARCYDGLISETCPIVVNPEDFASVTSVEVDFHYGREAWDLAYIMFADAAWANQNWGVDSADGVVVKAADVYGAGEYTVGLEFPDGAEGIAFAALGIVAGENTFPNYCISITDIRVDGVSITPVSLGYTSSDDGLCTRMNLYNEWVSELPGDARSFDTDNPEEVSPIVVNPEDFASFKTLDVDFCLVAPADEAYLMYADAAWANQNWGLDSSDTMEVLCAEIDGEGRYEVGLKFATPAEGLAFAALGIVSGEYSFPGWTIDIVDIQVNGESIDFAKGYTSSDDGVCTRMNIYNEWVSDLPSDAHCYGGTTEGASPIMVDTAAFASVSEILVTFDYHYGYPPVVADASQALTDEEAKELIAAGFNAYIGLQCNPGYVFRNAWDDGSYGLESNPEYFAVLTGWNAFLESDVAREDGSYNYGGSYEDAVIAGPGTYTVSLTTDEHGLGTEEGFNLLFVSTSIPSTLVDNGQVTISNVKTKIGADSMTRDYFELDTSGDYLQIKILDSYNQSSEPFAYTMPGANDGITITFDFGCIE